MGVSLLLALVLALAPVNAAGAELAESGAGIGAGGQTGATDSGQAGATTLDRGYLTFSDAYTGESREVYVEVDPHSGEIFAGADSIGAISGASVDQEGDQLVFDRGGYQVRVDLEGQTAMLYNQSGAVSRQVFDLPGYTGEDGVTYLPLEKSLYLLNVGWQILGQKVLAEAPSETFWNTLNEFEALVWERPMLCDLLGEGYLEQLGNSAKYTLWALADDLDYRLFVPFFGEGWIEDERCRDALYSLGVNDAEAMEGTDTETLESQLAGLAGDLRVFNENMATATDIPKNFSDLSGFLAENMGKPFTPWESLRNPDVAKLMAKNKEFTAAADGFALASAALNVADAVSRVRQWSDSYLGQLRVLGQARTERFTEGKDQVRRIVRVAQDAYEDSQNRGEQVMEEVATEVRDLLGTKIFELTPVGKVVNIYNLAVAAASASFPALQDGLEMGDDAYEGRMLINIGTVAAYQCLDQLNALTSLDGLSAEDLEVSRDAYLLMVRAYTRAWDKLLQVKEQDGYSYEGEKEELEAKRLRGYALSIRINESARYDNTLLLEEDYGNLYNSDIEAGGLREQIPLSLIHELSAGMAGNVVEAGDGTLYYWEYQAGSFESQAVLGNYQPVVGAVNRLMARTPSGEATVVTEAEGSGTLALVGDLLFFEKPVDNIGNTEICRLSLEDLSIQNLGAGKLQAVAGGRVICTDTYETQIDSIEPEDGTRTRIGEGAFLAVSEDLVYYQPPESDATAASRGQVTLAVAGPDGSDPRTLCTTAPDLSDGAFQGAACIVRMVFRGEDIYFSYGTYAGTGMFFQGGRIMRVKKDGSQAEVAAGSGELQDAIFTVREDGTVESHSNLDATVSIFPMDPYYAYNGSIYVFGEDGTAEELVAQADYASLAPIPCGVWDPEEGIGIAYAEKVGDAAYFLLDYGVAAPTGSVGWRTAYTRTSSALFRKDLATGQVETLYTY